jgi:mono/diheme cytochrome c family protein
MGWFLIDAQEKLIMKLSRVLAPVALALVATALCSTQSISAQSAGPYTDAQAKDGLAIYTAQCSMCHGDKLEGISGPALAGKDFIAQYSGQTADDVRDIIASQMPLTNPGSLKPAEVLAVLAYILQQNKYPSGDSALTAAKSKNVKIVKQG